MYSMVQAGSMGLPFLGVRGLLGTDILKYRPEFVVTQNPFQPLETVVVVAPLRPDVAVFHAAKADRWGNAVTPGLRNDLMMARASRRVIVTAEEIVEEELGPQDGLGETFLPQIDVDAVVFSPGGAHPGACSGRYPVDDAHRKEYQEAARSAEPFRAYLERWVYGTESEEEYRRRIEHRA